ncbi:MAG TPA: MFS transporter [Bdellovibrionota bacterium]|jgi:hypothetical protein|nr:MFS transporter [Bdellovibrionota bacterium]
MEAVSSARLPLVLRERNFGLLWLGQVLSQGGKQLYQMAVVWWIVQSLPQARSGIALALFLVTVAAPSLLLHRRLGQTVDRSAPRGLLVGADLTAAFSVALAAALFSVHVMPVWGVYVIGFAVAASQGLIDPGLNKALPGVVAEEDLEVALAFQSSTQSVASFGGAVAGAVLLSRLGVAGVAVLNALTYGLSALCTASVRFGVSAPAAVEAVAADSTQKVTEGMPFTRAALGTFAAVNFFGVPTLLLLPLYTRSVFHGGASLMAALESSVCLGMILGAALGPRLPKPQSLARFGAAALGFFGVALAMPGLAPRLAVLAPALVAAGAAIGVLNVKFLAFFQERVPAERKGRFFAALQAAVSAAFPIGYLVFGFLSSQLAPPSLSLIQGAGVLAVSAVFLTLRGVEVREVAA